LDLDRWIAQARAQGWTVEPTRNGHLWWRRPDGMATVTGVRLGDARALWNARAQLRRAGLRI